MHIPMRVFTCTPRPFAAHAGFWARDSGLFSVALRTLGHASKVVMLGPPQQDDDPEQVVRAARENLQDPGWWRALSLDGLVLYSWASPEYTPIAQAVRDAGVPCLVVMDTCGMISRLSNPDDWLREVGVRAFADRRKWPRFPAIFAKLAVEGLVHRTAKLRMPHYDAATKVSVVTPLGARWVANEARGCGRKDLAAKIVYLPHPQHEAFTHDGRAKENVVISVGRWHPSDWPQKNPKVLLDALLRFLKERPDWRAQVVGAGAGRLAGELGLGKPAELDRLELIDAVPPTELVDLYRRAKIGFWTSRWEGQQGTAAQALCCGCSVVSVNTSHMSCFRHYVSRGSGRLAMRNLPQPLADELVLEAEAWDQGHRDAAAIAATWSAEFHATKVAAEALSILGLNNGDLPTR